ncbi:SMC-Scp complex subunit ScpB [Flavihumibacter sp. R14]|nr:SMC-Scp complex subunit ScpB [Flavihumibacter soli]
MEPHQLENNIEALIYASDKAIGAEEIIVVLSELTDALLTIDEIDEAIRNIQLKYQDSKLSIELVRLNGGYQFLTKKQYYPVIKQLHIQRAKKALSQAALETLAIIAYKQPVTKLEVEQIRGVNCDYSVQKLLDKELIVISGRSSAVGKPILYAVSSMFMDYFGINSPADLPKLKELIPENNDIGQSPQ